MGSAYLQGLGVCAGLIVAIGAQNAHVLRMGIARHHVALTVATCIAIDVLLICLGVAGMGALIETSPRLMAAVRWTGAAFLLWYGVRSWRAAFSSQAMGAIAALARPGLRKAWLTVAALSLLNPHVYLDTLVLMGGIGARLPPDQRPGFMAGAISASVAWFCLIGFGAATLAPVLNRPVVWRCIDLLTGAMMFWLAASLMVN